MLESQTSAHKLIYILLADKYVISTKFLVQKLSLLMSPNSRPWQAKASSTLKFLYTVLGIDWMQFSEEIAVAVYNGRRSTLICRLYELQKQSHFVLIRADKCYTLPSRSNPIFNFWHSGTLALSHERQISQILWYREGCPNVRNKKWRLHLDGINHFYICNHVICHCTLKG